MRLNLCIFTAVLLGFASVSHAEPYSVQVEESFAATIVTPGAGNAAPLQSGDTSQAATATAIVAYPGAAEPQAVAHTQLKSDAPMYSTRDFQPSEGK